jgi:hypothetical protein
MSTLTKKKAFENYLAASQQGKFLKQKLTNNFLIKVHGRSSSFASQAASTPGHFKRATARSFQQLQPRHFGSAKDV